jgi:hypothetical protein
MVHLVLLEMTLKNPGVSNAEAPGGVPAGRFRLTIRMMKGARGFGERRRIRQTIGNEFSSANGSDGRGAKAESIVRTRRFAS